MALSRPRRHQQGQLNRAYILTHGVSGVDWAHYKHPLPEHVYDVYMKYRKDVVITRHEGLLEVPLVKRNAGHWPWIALLTHGCIDSASVIAILYSNVLQLIIPITSGSDAYACIASLFGASNT